MIKYKMGLCLLLLLLGIYTEGVAQVAINTDGSSPSTNMILDLNPAVGKAFAPPAMTWAQIKAISPATEGMVVFDTEFHCLRMYNGTKWARITEQSQFGEPSGSVSIQTVSGTLISTGVSTDAAGNVYIIGNFTGTATFGALTPIQANNQDIFIAKYNSNGTALWVQKAGGLLDDYAKGIAIDVSGNVYIAGNFSGTATFAALTPIVSAGNVDIFVAKYNSNGTALWVQKAGGILDDNPTSIAVDVSGNAYITGSFTATATFGALSPLVSAGTNRFIAKYDTNGTVQWAQKTGGDYANSIAIDGSNNVYITGSFTGTTTFGALPPLVSAGSADIFVAKYNSSGTAQWVQKAGGTLNDYANSIAVDVSGNLYISGHFSSTATFGTLPPIVAVSTVDIFVAKYNNSGVGQWQWVVNASVTTNSFVQSIAIDALNNIYITGYYAGSLTLGILPALTSTGSTDIFVAKYDSNGIAQWIQKAGGLSGDGGTDIAVDVSGNLYTTGYYTPSAQFGKHIFTTGNIFLMKYSE